MSFYDYHASKVIEGQGLPFYAIVMAAMRQADAPNGAKLRDAWPEVWDELRARYNAPGGLLEGESVG